MGFAASSDSDAFAKQYEAPAAGLVSQPGTNGSAATESLPPPPPRAGPSGEAIVAKRLPSRVPLQAACCVQAVS